MMPDPQEAREAGITSDYSAYRSWWARTVLGLKVPKRRTNIVKPEPATVDGVDLENG